MRSRREREDRKHTALAFATPSVGSSDTKYLENSRLSTSSSACQKIVSVNVPEIRVEGHGALT
jgi:hypothetical protein